MKPWIHAQNSAKKWGGIPEDYFEIHDLMDCSKGAFPTNAHRALTHNGWFIKEVLERIKFSNSCAPIGNSFPFIINSDKKQVSVRDIGEQHILEDFGMKFLPSAQDYLQEINYQPWMGNAKGEYPPSFKRTIPNKAENEGILTRPSMPDRVYDGNIGGSSIDKRVLID